jgi:hypothetical protein
MKERQSGTVNIKCNEIMLGIFTVFKIHKTLEYSTMLTATNHILKRIQCETTN